MHVRCETPPYPATTKESIPGDYAQIGFKEEKGLMIRLKHEQRRANSAMTGFGERGYLHPSRKVLGEKR